MAPRFSIVIPALNSEQVLARALDSIAAQEIAYGVEIIVADGGSTDNTIRIASAYADTRVLPGPDAGIYHGVNKALAAATGTIIGWLNSDDLLYPGTLKSVGEAFARDSTLDFVSGGVTIGPTADPRHWLEQEEPLSPKGILFGIPAINARFFRKDFLLGLGPLDPSAGLGADRELLLRAAKRKVRSAALPRPVYHYSVHAGSTTIAGDKGARERLLKAEIVLNDYVRRHYGSEPDVLNSVATAETLSALRLHAARLRGLDPSPALVARTSSVSPLRLVVSAPWALHDWWTWRRRLSGY
ncbi:glycosyltransferase [Hyphomicrobium sp.]|uniref:glycosyltransferase n=1 Tax=Hyphomicrobium sp. TaxID=82 RepID=UPI0025C6D22F|nr:glycosyltransferase [Hyphomicrobium sp.]MCC7253453.1 glycosyltransferase [Hyphomicrobium sp.]